MIFTTANLDIITYNKLINSSKELGIPVKRVVHVLFKIMLNERPVRPFIFSTVKYQDSRPGREWKRFHLEMNEGSYEACIDLRKLLKLSVPYILDIAVNLYLDRVKKEFRTETTTDNYPEFYMFLCSHTPEISVITIFFIPPKPNDIPNYHKYADT